MAKWQSCISPCSPRTERESCKLCAVRSWLERFLVCFVFSVCERLFLSLQLWLAVVAGAEASSQCGGRQGAVERWDVRPRGARACRQFPPRLDVAAATRPLRQCRSGRGRVLCPRSRFCVPTGCRRRVTPPSSCTKICATPPCYRG